MNLAIADMARVERGRLDVQVCGRAEYAAAIERLTGGTKVILGAGVLGGFRRGEVLRPILSDDSLAKIYRMLEDDFAQP